jgi:ferredoxin
MHTVTVNDRTITVPEGTRLVHAIREAGIEIGHRCGGKARCTTCRVEVHAGVDERMTRAEFVRLLDAGLLDQVRLSCQVIVQRDVHVTALKTKASEGWADTGPLPDTAVVPEAAWFDRDTLAADTPTV